VTAEPEPSELQAYSIQLLDVHCASLHGERRITDQPAEGARDIDISLETSALSEDGKSFGCRLTVANVIPVLEREVVEYRLLLEGSFVSETPIDPELHRRFVTSTTLVLFWPYARAYVASLTALLGVSIPALPTLDARRAIRERPDSPAGE
jgi:preprotein translocase subunit SecB